MHMTCSKSTIVQLNMEILVNQDNQTVLDINFLLYVGPASEELVEVVGEQCDYNIKVTYFRAEIQMTNFGIIVDGGLKVHMKGMLVYTAELINESELKNLSDDFDSIEAPPGPYQVQPGEGGRLVWLTGAPGMGKSTTAQVLGRDHGYVYYEADCFFGLKNPFVDLNVDNPSLAQLKQKHLKGWLKIFLCI